MSRIVVQAFITLDGVVQAGGGPDEDREGGFLRQASMACSRSIRHRYSTTSVASSSLLSGCASSASLAAISLGVEPGGLRPCQ